MSIVQKRNNFYGCLTFKKIEEVKRWDMVHVELIGPSSKSIREHHPDGAIIKNNVSLTCMTMIDPTTGWFEIVKVLMYDLNEVTGGNDEYIDKFSARVRQLFNTT